MRKTVLLSVASFCFAAAGCRDSEVKTYRIAKEEKPSLPVAQDARGDHAHGQSRPATHVHGAAPAGWVEQPASAMRAASFLIRGDGDRMAQMALIPMPGAKGIELQSVNMWREQELGLEPWSEAQLKSESQAIDVGALKGTFIEMAGKKSSPGEDFTRRTLGAIFDRNGTLWFAKMSGEDSLVSAQKENFRKYLNSLDFHDGAHGEPAASAPMASAAAARSEQVVSANTAQSSADSSQPKWNPPANWKAKAPGPMVLTAYTVEAAGGQADVTITKLSSDGGGMAPNVNRWRGQLGLSPASDAELKASVATIEVAGKKDSYLADLKGTNVRSGKPSRMLAAGVPQGGETWFYKLLGDEAAVEKEKEAFVKFIQGAH